MSELKVQKTQVDFALPWSEKLRDLNPNTLNLTDRVKKVAHDTFFKPFKYTFTPLLDFVIPCNRYSESEIRFVEKEFDFVWKDKNPNIDNLHRKSTWKHIFPTNDALKELRKNYSHSEFHIQTPDGQIIQGSHFQSARAKKNPKTARTLLLIGGRSQLLKSGGLCYLFPVLQRSKIPFNIIAFDPRGFGRSSGNPSQNGFIIDAETIYQYIHKQLEIPEDRIDIYGYSLGGGTATQLKSRHSDTKGCLINDRSFNSILDEAKVATKHFIPGIIGGLLAAIFAWLIYHFGWIFNSGETWESILSKKMVITHKDDPVIFYEASLYRAIKEKNLLKDSEVIELNSKPGKEHIIDHHTEDLRNYVDQDGVDTQWRLLKFLEKQHLS